MCVNPLRIRNKATGLIQYVACGHCYECINSRNMDNAKLLQLEADSYKYCEFSLFTYNSVCLPRVYYSDLELTPDSHCVIQPFDSRTFETSPALSFYDERDGVVKISAKDYRLSVLQFRAAREVLSGKKMNKANTFAVLCFSDIQKAVKRIRKRLETLYVRNVLGFSSYKSFQKLKKNEKIQYKIPRLRYYIIGEYSPRNLRPHYHACFYHDNEFYRSVFKDVVRACWPHGFSNNKHTTGRGCQKYVTQYITSSSSLPALLRSVAPARAIHSIRLGGEYVRKFDKDLSEEVHDLCRGLVEVRPATNAPTRYSVRIANRIFPKFPRYGSTAFSEVLRVVEDVLRLRQQFREGVCDDTTRVAYRMAQAYGRMEYIYMLPRSIREYYEFAHSQAEDRVSACYRLFSSVESMYLNSREFGLGFYVYMNEYRKYYDFVNADKMNNYYKRNSEYYATSVSVISQTLRVPHDVAYCLYVLSNTDNASQLADETLHPDYESVRALRMAISSFEPFRCYSVDEVLDYVRDSLFHVRDCRETLSRELYLSLVKHRVQNEKLDTINYQSLKKY